MAMMRYSDTTAPVERLVQDIDRGELALPDLQRPYVWPASKARDLFDSMYQGFPVGSLLLWKTGADSDARKIGRASGRAVPRQLIVDGQQRLTSLFAVFTGHPVLTEDFTQRTIRIGFRPADATFAVTDAAVEKDPEFLPDITQLWQPSSRKRTIRGFLDQLAAKRELDEDERDRLDTALDDLYNLKDYTFKVVELSDTVGEEEVAEIFVRINSSGVTLKQADFILTLMSVYWEDGRRDLETFCREARQPGASRPSPFNWYIKPEPAELLRVTAAVALRRAVLKQVYAVLRGRDAETGQVSVKAREEQFSRLQQAQKHVLDLTNWHEFLQCLERAGFRGEKMISSGNAVLYSYALWLIGRVDYGVPLDRLKETVARWFFMAHTTSRYSGSFESQVEQDLTRLGSVAPGDADGYLAVLAKVVDDTLTPDFWAITLPNSLDTSAAKSPTLMAYLAALNIHDAEALLSTTGVRSRLDPAVTLKKGIERHHLFPRNHLKQQGITETQRINQIANMAMVEWSDNIAISDRPPAVYWPEQLAAKQPSAERLAKQLYWHALPDGWASMAYSDFLAARRTLMAVVIRDAFAKLADTAYSPAYPSPIAVAPTPAATLVRVADLVEAELLPPGTTLVFKHDNGITGFVDADGRIVLDGTPYDSPTAATRAAGYAGQPWPAWIAQLPGGPASLDDLRSLYRIQRP